MAKLKRANGFFYIIEKRFVDVDGKQVKKYVTVEKLGKISKQEAAYRLFNYNTLGKRETNLPFHETYTLFIEHYKKSAVQPRTIDRFIDSAKVFYPYFKYFSMRTIKFRHIEEFKDSIRDRYSNRGINIILGSLSLILKFSVQREIIEFAPMIQRLPQSQNKEVYRLTEHQIDYISVNIKTLFKHEVAEKVAFYFYLMLYTGMRPVECARLKYSDNNLKKNYLSIHSNNLRKKGRLIPIHTRLKELLQSWVEKYPPNNFNSLVSPYSSSGAATMLKRIAKHTDIKVGPYILRKTFGSMMAESGVTYDTLSEIMGNSVDICKKYYLNIRVNTLAPEIQKLSF